MSRSFSVDTSLERSGPFDIVKLRLTGSGLEPAFHGYRIVQLSDLHFGLCTPFEHLQSAWEIARGLQPDLLLLTGDLVQYGGIGFRRFLATRLSPGLFGWIQYRRRVRRLVQALAKLPAAWSPPDGIIGVFGNHEYLEGIGTVRRQLEAKVLWLKNSAAHIQRGQHQLLIFGLDDVNRGKPSLRKTLRLPDEIPADNITVCRIMVCHNPDLVTLPHAELLENMDLILCGHTHGGQICLPGGKPIMTRTRQREIVSGLNAFRGTPVYVSRGVGTGVLPFRLFCPPEITLIEFARGEN